MQRFQRLSGTGREQLLVCCVGNCEFICETHGMLFWSSLNTHGVILAVYPLSFVVLMNMMETARTSETSVDNYFTRQYIPEDKSELHTRRPENLKSHILSLSLTEWAKIILQIYMLKTHLLRRIRFVTLNILSRRKREMGRIDKEQIQRENRRVKWETLQFPRG
jgi:hypothetical protein